MTNARVESVLPGRAMLLAVAAALLAFSAWTSLSIGVSDFLAASGSARAVSWNPANASARLQVEEAMAREHGVAADKLESIRTAIRGAPLDGRGYRLLARHAEQVGNRRKAAELYALAVQRGPRDLPSLAWLMDYEMSIGDYAAALTRIDRMLRIEPELAMKLESTLAAMALDARAQPEVARLLERQPPWRTLFLSKLLARSPEPQSLFSLVERLRSGPSGLAAEELAAWLDRLIRSHEWGTAYLTWVESLPPEASQRVGNVYDGDFSREPTDTGFDWRFDPIKGAIISRSEADAGAQNYALRVEFDGSRVPFRNVRQLLALAPGNYQLRFRARMENLRAERGLVWTLGCAEGGRPFGETEPLSGRTGWRQYVMDFEVPATNCGGQWLVLRIPARIAAEQRASGTAWFDDLAIRASRR